MYRDFQDIKDFKRELRENVNDKTYKQKRGTRKLSKRGKDSKVWSLLLEKFPGWSERMFMIAREFCPNSAVMPDYVVTETLTTSGTDKCLLRVTIKFY